MDRIRIWSFLLYNIVLKLFIFLQQIFERGMLFKIDHFKSLTFFHF